MEKTVDLRLFRKANGITQSAVAEWLGVSKQFISQVESGKAQLSDEKLSKILDRPDWSMEKYLQLEDTLAGIQAQASGEPEEEKCADRLHRVRLIPFEAAIGLVSTLAAVGVYLVR